MPTHTKSEFDIIQQYFAPLSRISNPFGCASSQNTTILMGDDGAVLHCPADKQLVVTSDTLIAGVHFPADMDPAAVGYRCLATNVSDLAAMAAIPAWYSLCITLPSYDSAWLKAFVAGLAKAGRLYHITLAGGDTTCGAQLTVSMQLLGFVDAGKALTRSGAQPGDLVYVTGTLGSVAAGLSVLLQNGHSTGYLIDGMHEQPQTYARLMQSLKQAFCYPQIHVNFAAALGGTAHSAIDLSDGFAADLQHIARASRLKANIYLDAIPIEQNMPLYFTREQIIQWALNGGDDYALCFTISPSMQNKLEYLARTCNVHITQVGEMVQRTASDKTGSAPITFWSARNGQQLDYAVQGYQHF